MLVKETSLILAVSNSALSFASAATSSTSLTFRRAHEGTRPPPCRRNNERRGYATIANEESADGNGRTQIHVWPTPPKGHTCPTPYQIFAMSNNGTYSKTRFYELVKQYHPDLSHTQTPPTKTNASDLSTHEKMERYRLVVAAHAILSNPARRSAYDRFGAGWAGRADHRIRNGASNSSGSSWSYTAADDPIWQNATWEDWERFYARRAREQNPNDPTMTPQAPVYFRNSYFIALVGLVALMGSTANYTRAQDAGTYFVEQRDIVHDKASKELRKVRNETKELGDRDARIRWFLRQREATTGQASDVDIEEMREERAKRVLPDGEVCSADDVSGR